jgi:hypothetical protein
MKFAIFAVALTLASAAPTLADDHRGNNGHGDGHGNGHGNGRMMMQHRPMPERDPHRFHQGQVWHGHHLVYRSGYWGYQQPSNGLFIHINL